ncbi:MAG: LysR family transcriptional regulator [Lachnospiraceae bacterium]|nr:LysR family transcriptional regulator [Lachnospiraceae bacterium]
MLSNKVYTLLKVYECGSFIGAAEQLNLTQPAVSQHIKALEEELGVTVFDRGNGKVTLTKQGSEVIQYAKKLVGVYDQLKQDIRDGSSLKAHLTIGVTHTAESNPIVESLASYGAKNPNVNIKIITDNIKNLYTALKSYEVDLAFVEGRGNDPDIRYLLLDTDHLVLAVAPDHPLAKKSMVTLNELKKERMILRLPDSGTRNLFIAHLESNNMNINDFNIILEVDNIATIKDLVRQNFGVTVLAQSVCLDEIKKGKIVTLPVENLSMIRDVNIAYPADFTKFDFLQEIVNCYNSTMNLYKTKDDRYAAGR